MPRPLRALGLVLGGLLMLTVFAIGPVRAGPLEVALNTVFVVRSADDADRFLGSAFLWGADGVAVTNAHVVGAADEVRLTDAAGAEQVARVIARDPARDVAVIAVTGGGEGLNPGPAPALGQEVWALGAPLGLDFTVTRGMVSAPARQVEPAVPLRLVQHDAAVNPGSSGGPLVDAEGRLLGMNSRIADGSRYYVGVSYAIAAQDLARIVPGLIAETLAPVPDLGLRMRPVTRQIGGLLGVAPGGLLVDEVAPGGLAARGGLRAGDVILAAGGVALHQPGDLAFRIEAGLGAGQIPLELWRAGAAVALTLGLEAPAPQALATRGLAGALRVKSYRLEGLGLRLGEGAVVTEVTENSPALWAGVAQGDRVLALNGAALDLDALRAFEITEPLLLLVRRAGGATVHLLVDPWARGGQLRPVGGANVLDPAVVVF